MRWERVASYIRHPIHAEHRWYRREADKQERQPCRTWADLPKELLAFIAEEVGPSLVRSVCRSWRDSVDTTRTVLSPAIFHPAQIVQRFPSLTHLDLSPCSITVSDDRLQQLQQLTNLQTLNLKGCAQLTPAGLKPLAQCSALQNIILGGELDSVPRTAFQGEKELNNKVTDEMLSVIASISTLNAVDVGFSSRCTCKGVMNLAPLSNLQCLSVTGLSSLDSGSLTAENVAKLVSMPRLAVLEIGVVAPSAFASLSKLTPTCTSLDVHGDRWEISILTEEELSHLGALDSLTHLGLYNYEIMFRQKQDRLGSQAACTLLFLQRLKQLIWFQLTSCIVPHGADLAFLAQCGHIERLQLWMLSEPETEAEQALGGTTRDSPPSTASGQPVTGRDTHQELPPPHVSELSVRLNEGAQSRVAAWIARAPALKQLQWDCATRAGAPQATQPLQYSAFSGWASQSLLREIDMGEGMVLAPSAIASIATFPKLNRLTCHVQGALPSEASSLTALGAVQITWDERMDEGMALLGSLTRLSELHCGCKEPGTDASLSALQNLSALTALIFIPQPDGPSIGRKGLESIAHLTNLRRLDLTASTALSEDDLSCLAPLTWLQHLDLGGFATISDVIIEMLEPLRRLRHVWLRVPRKVMWLQRTKAVQCTHAALASLATSHLELSFLCFGNAQMASFPHVALDFWTLERLALAASHGELDTIDESLVWIP